MAFFHRIRLMPEIYKKHPIYFSVRMISSTYVGSNIKSRIAVPGIFPVGQIDLRVVDQKIFIPAVPLGQTFADTVFFRQLIKSVNPVTYTSELRKIMIVFTILLRRSQISDGFPLGPYIKLISYLYRSFMKLAQKTDTTDDIAYIFIVKTPVFNKTGY